MAANEPSEAMSATPGVGPRPMRMRGTAVLLRMQAHLAHLQRPRFHMALIVALTGVLSFVASDLLLYNGLTALWLRYPAAVALAYGVFLMLLWAWVQSRGADFADTAFDAAIPRIDSDTSFGASDADGTTAQRETPELPQTESSVQEFAGMFQLEDVAFTALALILLGGAVSTAVSMVWNAPALLCELVLVAVLCAGLYRGMRNTDQTRWMQTALTRAVWRFAAVALLLLLIGAATQLYAPGAISVGELFGHDCTR